MPPRIDQLALGPLGTNCYVVRSSPEANEAVVVDPSGTATEIRLRLASLGVRCVAILVTHTHFDHILGVADLAEGTDAPVYAPAAERVVLERPADYTPAGIAIRGWTPNVTLGGGEHLELGGVGFDVVSTPGHSPGHVTYAVDGALLSGDVLFEGSVGRVDLPGGDWQTLLASIRSLIESYPPETAVLPGHGRATTLGAELARNPFLGDLRLEQESTR